MYCMVLNMQDYTMESASTHVENIGHVRISIQLFVRFILIFHAGNISATTY